MSEVAVYIGQRCLGYVREHPDRCEAFDAEGQALGVFPNRRTATTAVWHKACRSSREEA